MIILLIMFIFDVITIIPLWMICKKAGLPGIISLLWFIPIIDIFLLFYIACVKWPTLKCE